MPKINLNSALDDDFDSARAARARSGKVRRSTRTRHRTDHDISAEIARRSALDEHGAESVFNPTFSGSRYEREWILKYLGGFYEDGQITDVLHQVKGGKEAVVYCCAAHPVTGLELLAAKVYRPRAFRKMRNDAQYRQGRQLLDDQGLLIKDERALRAVMHKTGFGREVEHTSWLEHEFITLRALHDAGADVPRPVAHGHNTILMEYLGDVEAPAPTLHEIRLTRAEVRPLFERLMQNVALMLACGRVHADLSAFNVLYWEGAIKIIDFPQAVNPYTNRDAYAFFQRDVTRLCQYFARYGLRRQPAELARALWAQAGLVEDVPEAGGFADEEA